MFPFKHASGKVVLIADVDDMSVGISAVELSPKKPATILLTERMVLPMEERTGSQSTAAVTQILEQALDAAIKRYIATDSKNNPRPIGACYAIVRSPWTHFRSAEAEERAEKSRATTQELISKLAKKALESPSELDRAHILEAGVMRVSLNGYPTGKPLGKRAIQIGVVAFESDINAEIRSALEAAFGKFVPGRKLIIKSGASAMLTVLHEILPDIHRCVILDIGSSSSSIAVMRKDSVMQTASVKEGTNSIIKRVSNTALPEEVFTQLRMLTAESCSTDACKALKDSMGRAEPEITKIFGETFATLAAQRRFPNTAILSSAIEISPWLHGFFARIDFAQFTATMQPLTIEPLSVDLLKSVVTWNTGVRVDIGLGVASGYVNILEE